MTKKIFKPKRSFKGRTVPDSGLAPLVASIGSEWTNKGLPGFRAGDTIKVHQRIKEGSKERIQIFEGVCIKRKRQAEGSSFTVRKISHGVGVEKIYQEASPKVAKVELVTTGKVRRSRLYYLRKLEGRAAKIERDLNTKR